MTRSPLFAWLDRWFALRARYDIVRAFWDRRQRGKIGASDETAFDAWCMARFDAYVTVLVIVAILIALVLASTSHEQQGDLPGLPAAFATFEIRATAFMAVFVVIPRTRWVRRHLVLLFGLCLGPGLYLAQYPFAALGGPDEPWIHLWYIVPLWMVGLPMRLHARAALGICIGVAMVAGVFVPFPEYWSSPWAPQVVRQVIGAVGISIGLGHFVQHLYRRTFIQMQALTRQGEGLAVEVSQLAAQVDTTQETERTRIARDLHDDLGQEIEGLRYAMALTKQRFAADPSVIGPNLTELERLLARTSSSMQGVMAELRPRILDDLGLTAGVTWLASRIAERSSLECDVVVEGLEERLDSPRRTAAFRIIQEALTNILKHAGARRATVTIAIGASELDLTIVDDGRGLSPAIAGASVERPAGGMGLINMRERARSLGGTLVVADRSGGGVEVRCNLPLGDHA